MNLQDLLEEQTHIEQKIDSIQKLMKLSRGPVTSFKYQLEQYQIRLKEVQEELKHAKAKRNN